MTVWVAFSRGEFHGHDVPPGPRVFVGVYGTREEALENCWPKGDARWVEEAVVRSSEPPTNAVATPPLNQTPERRTDGRFE